MSPGPPDLSPTVPSTPVMSAPPIPGPPLPARPAGRSPLLRRAALLGAVAALGWAAWATGREVWGGAQLRAAARAIEAREFETARPHIANARAVWPRDPALCLLEARTARRADQLADVGARLDEARRLGASGMDTLLEDQLLAAQRGGLADVEAKLRERQKAAPADYVLIAEVLTTELMRTYRLAEARGQLNGWLERAPDDFEGYLRRGWVAERQLDYPAAVADYRRVVALRPDRDAVRLRLAELLVQTNLAADAVPLLTDLYARSPADPAVVLAWARCRRELGELAEAAAVLDGHTAAGGEEGPEIIGEKGRLALQAGDLDAAERLLREANRRAPANRMLLYSLQMCLSRRGKAAEAAELANTLKTLDADTRRMGEIVAAVGGKPTDPGLRSEGGIIFLRNGLPDDGLRWLGLALELDPDHRPAHQALAEHFEKTGRPNLAAPHRAVLARPDSAGRP
ncbi:MAG: tetratricopeptide repeat protein [Gemmataceae bacterium]|nr:tetratricopeptide repeat protein [Gemmataceae bacterium]